MSETKFTPGPWHVEASEDAIRIDICADPIHCGNLPICRMYGSMDTVAQDNAHLIAAAPEMYAALESVCVSCQLRDHETDCGNCRYGKVLRKVRGESEVEE